jgi:3-deoxy-manno-octulosonate cytidylyltransferase (CMP-KDO synthetase)
MGTILRMKTLGVIPARMNSSRLPGKVLKDIGGNPVVAWVYEAAKRSSRLDDLIVATDSDEVYSACVQRGIPVTMTSTEHRCGSDRIREVSLRIPADIYVNIQGDEPMLTAEHIDLLLSPFYDERASGVQVTTLKVKIDSESAKDPGNVKVVCALDGKALYFSRSVIPYDRDHTGHAHYYKHIGLYAYRAAALEQFSSLPPSSLELSENLEQLRLLENGLSLYVTETTLNTVGVDTPEDLERVRLILAG